MDETLVCDELALLQWLKQEEDNQDGGIQLLGADGPSNKCPGATALLLRGACDVIHTQYISNILITQHLAFH